MGEGAVSILMPTFNSGDFLLEAVDSAASQLGPDDEIVIQDGGSTDGSIDTVRERYADVPQVKIVSAPDGGQADALNRALARAENPFVGWLNGDDCYYPGALEAFRRGLELNPSADIVHGSWTLYTESGEILRVCVPRQLDRAGLMRTPQIFTGASYFRTAAVRQAGGFDPELHYCMDIDLVARLLQGGSVPTLVPETLGGFRWYYGSKTGALEFGVVRECLKIRRRYADSVGSYFEAYFFSATQAVTQAAIPLRRTRLYARLRNRGSKAERAAALSES
ncbi:MAG TPA: glycosyltransferase [Acidimicrobiales bacterium]|jgi:glycosyltransferase involved in cell wall biosynthesis